MKHKADSRTNHFPVAAEKIDIPPKLNQTVITRELVRQ